MADLEIFRRIAENMNKPDGELQLNAPEKGQKLSVVALACVELEESFNKCKAAYAERNSFVDGLERTNGRVTLSAHESPPQSSDAGKSYVCVSHGKGMKDYILMTPEQKSEFNKLEDASKTALDKVLLENKGLMEKYGIKTSPYDVLDRAASETQKPPLPQDVAAKVDEIRATLTMSATNPAINYSNSLQSSKGMSPA
jgi:hypothetical protein